jgi:nucleotide sugar dehydrogenase
LTLEVPEMSARAGRKCSIGVIGLGKLGLPVACYLSKHLYYEDTNVIGYDINSELIDALVEGTLEVREPDCNYKSVIFTDLLEYLVDRTNTSFLCVNTPTNNLEQMDLSQVTNACKELKKYIKNKKYTLIVLSTLIPGTTEHIIKPILGDNVNVIVHPVWIAMGSVVHDLQNPPITLIGNDKEENYPDVVEMFSDAPTLITTPTNAEYLKLIHNAWCTIKMSFIGEIGDKTPIDRKVLSIFFELGGERTGRFWKYGPPFGGPCFPRDLGFFNQSTYSELGKTTLRVNS